MRIFHHIVDWQYFRRSPHFQGKSLGFVPTMGCLHEGHLSLVRRSQQENDVTLVTIFVNPTQFDNLEDLKKYPVTPEKDQELLRSSGVDVLLSPDYQELYPDDFRYAVHEKEFSTYLCGAYRPGHFDGVLTVVLKLLNLVQADRAYFGEKDFQQLTLIEAMAKSFFLPTAIVACPTVRESDGLAMSSRNVRLNEHERQLAANFPRLLMSGKSPAGIISELKTLGFLIDYVEEWNGRRFGAVHIGKVRLIDNVEIERVVPAQRLNRVL